MLDLNYYFVDVGQNTCEITKRHIAIDIFDAMLKKDKVRLKIARELLLAHVKNRSKFLQNDDFKLVGVLKCNKIWTQSEVIRMETRENVEPLISNDERDVYIMRPGERLDVTCQVVKWEIENRSLPYETIDYVAKVKVKQ